MSSHDVVAVTLYRAGLHSPLFQLPFGARCVTHVMAWVSTELAQTPGRPPATVAGAPPDGPIPMKLRPASRALPPPHSPICPPYVGRVSVVCTISRPSMERVTVR